MSVRLSLRSLITGVLIASVAFTSASAQVVKPPPRAPGAPPPVESAVLDTTQSTIPYFALGTSPLALSGTPRAGMYMSAVGRRAIAMGTEDGRLELWSWPIKWLHDFQLAFRVPKYTQAIPAGSVVQRVTERPEGITIEYAYEQFTVREHVFVPLDIPAVVMLLEVDAVRPLEIVAQFTPDIHFAWPAGLGGQYLVWEQNARAFLFSEGKQKINAFLGSPAVTEASDVPAHMLAAAPPQLVLGVGGAAERYTAPRLGEPPGRGINAHVAYIPIVLAGGEMPHDSALALYRRLVAPGAAKREWDRRVAHADSLRRTMFSIRSPDSLLDEAVEYAKVNLDESFVCNPDLGCGLVAGYGLSGGSTDRPGFGWFFGGDAAINSFALTSTGATSLVREGALRFFAKYQRADGKITHEISQGAGHVDWFSYPYPYYHGDTTPFWVLACGEYWLQTADTTLVRELWPNLVKAYEWSRRTDTNGDGLMENPAAGAGALEVGDLQIGILSDVYMNGVWVASLDRFARMAKALGHRELADSAAAIRLEAVRTMESRLWLPALRQYGFALLQDGSVNENLTSWPATAMSFDVFDEAHGADMAERLASTDIMTDWGARPLSATSTLFDPLHYNNGAVWPFVTGFVSLAEYRYHNAPAGALALEAIARTTFDQSLGRNAEVFSGRLYKPLDTAVPQQFFATSMVLTPLIRGLLGIEAYAPTDTLIIAPHLPPTWDSVHVDNVAFGASRVSFTIRREAGAIAATLHRTGGDTPINLVFSPALPLGARPSPAGTIVNTTPGDVHVPVSRTLVHDLEVRVMYNGGWSIAPPAMPPAIGERSKAPRILSERLVQENGGARYVARLQGLAGRTYRFRVRGPADGSAWRSVDVHFPDSGANADGYTTTTLSLSR